MSEQGPSPEGGRSDQTDAKMLAAAHGYYDGLSGEKKQLVDWHMASGEAQKVSRLLWEAREIASMYYDVIKKRTGLNDHYSSRLIRQIDAYRALKGWSPDGFGGEGPDGHE